MIKKITKVTMMILVMIVSTKIMPVSDMVFCQELENTQQNSPTLIEETTTKETNVNILSQKKTVKNKVSSASIKKINKVKYVKSNLKLRNKPSFKGKVKKILKLGTKVKCYYIINNTWVKTKTGYVYFKYLSNKPIKIVKKSDSRLKGVRKMRADRIAKVCIAKYKKYGVLPSVCIAQAFVETGIGTAYNNGNLWGINSNKYGGYPSIEDGCIAYLKVINNGYYRGAPFEKSYKRQITKILRGGYCTNPFRYISNVIWTIKKYKLYDYDKYVK